MKQEELIAERYELALARMSQSVERITGITLCRWLILF